MLLGLHHGRALTNVSKGIGNGFLTSMIPVYMAEIATEKKLRGRGVNAMIAAASLGTALAYWV